MSAGLCPLACVRWLARKVDIVTACTASTCLKGYVGGAALRFPGHSRGKGESKCHCDSYDVL